VKELLQQLNKAFDNKIRLGVMSVISVNRSATFNELKELLDLTDGNLASHIKKLEELGYISVHKSFFERKPNTVYQITEEGKAAFELHLKALEAILNQQ
jgi:DNA-binding MarR family transcriptional regulator